MTFFSETDLNLIYDRQKCNGRSDCSNGEDEQSCPTTTTKAPTTTTPATTTTTTQRPTTTVCTGFKCKLSNLCLPSSIICDGYVDCKGTGEDEECCNVKTDFRCPSSPGSFLGFCIPKQRVCDSFNDCGDGGDETNCTTTTTAVSKISFCYFLYRLRRFCCSLLLR